MVRRRPRPEASQRHGRQLVHAGWNSGKAKTGKSGSENARRAPDPGARRCCIRIEACRRWTSTLAAGGVDQPWPAGVLALAELCRSRRPTGRQALAPRYLTPASAAFWRGRRSGRRRTAAAAGEDLFGTDVGRRCSWSRSPDATRGMVSVVVCADCFRVRRRRAAGRLDSQPLRRWMRAGRGIIFGRKSSGSRRGRRAQRKPAVSHAMPAASHPRQQ